MPSAIASERAKGLAPCSSQKACPKSCLIQFMFLTLLGYFDSVARFDFAGLNAAAPWKSACNRLFFNRFFLSVLFLADDKLDDDADDESSGNGGDLNGAEVQYETAYTGNEDGTDDIEVFALAEVNL